MTLSSLMQTSIACAYFAYTDCPPGTYKEGSTCKSCPANSNTATYNMPICHCLRGFFRTTSEGPADACSCKPQYSH